MSPCINVLVVNVATRFAEERLHQFLVGLDDSLYGIVRSNLLSRVLAPTLDEAYQTLTQDESSRGFARGKVAHDEVHVFDVIRQGSPKPRSDRVDKSKLFYSYCRLSGYELCSCFKLIGYPEWWPDKARRGQGASSRLGHVGRPAQAVSVPGATRPGVTAANAVVHPNPQLGSDVDQPQLAPDQISALLSLLQPHSHDTMTD
ncbi:hypothetical protein LIER_09972 [Lithospermum erythrorhizon]|uniref:Uncharacterized protein n=1 Tax=Lithospermum erythrorhizon TaxID=34254 RepID=A0AAV3PHP4_LITER